MLVIGRGASCVLSYFCLLQCSVQPAQWYLPFSMLGTGRSTNTGISACNLCYVMAVWPGVSAVDRANSNFWSMIWKPRWQCDWDSLQTDSNPGSYRDVYMSKRTISEALPDYDKQTDKSLVVEQCNTVLNWAYLMETKNIKQYTATHFYTMLSIKQAINLFFF